MSANASNPNFDPTIPVLVVVRATRFWLTRNELAQFSGVFGGMFIDAPDIGVSEEGTLAHPLELHGIEVEEFTPLVHWLRFGANPPDGRPFTKDQLVRMLRLADLYDMPEATAFCFQGLQQLETDPFFLLDLIVRYKNWPLLHQYVERAVKCPLVDWSFDNADLYIPLLKLKVSLDEVRRIAAAVPTVILKAPTCTNHSVCVDVWRRDWRLHITEAVFRPVVPQALNQCYAAMVAQSPQPTPCRQRGLRVLQFNEDFDAEIDLLQDTANLIRARFDV
ncbi:hypothetical protein CVT24_002388 [Panaeolus cyanescens]|uniref:Uncharacterized protein n=1 Tax=Panaeolus cyanescens TaxID=181874 RepID=A0A409WVE4_9AGAR|nr:hypothetical protein CVT24_002388 [Panaeolus cyanescens]